MRPSDVRFQDVAAMQAYIGLRALSFIYAIGV